MRFEQLSHFNPEVLSDISAVFTQGLFLGWGLIVARVVLVCARGIWCTQGRTLVCQALGLAHLGWPDRSDHVALDSPAAQARFGRFGFLTSFYKLVHFSVF